MFFFLSYYGIQNMKIDPDNDWAWWYYKDSARKIQIKISVSLEVKNMLFSFKLIKWDKNSFGI